MKEVFSHIVPQTAASVRLSDYGQGVFPGLVSRAGFKKAIKRGDIYVNGRMATTGIMVVPGMQIQWYPSEKPPTKTFYTALDVVYEDDYLAVVRKPGGLVVSGNRFQTLENALPAHLMHSSQTDGLASPRAVHRLDAPTSGLVLMAKTRSCRVMLGSMMEEKKIIKKYIAVVLGSTPDQWQANYPVDGKEALTQFQTVNKTPERQGKALSMIQAIPHTGRTHQIRKHLFQDNFPVLGDKIYCQPGLVLKGKGLFLCATELIFIHPVTNDKLEVSIPPPPKFYKFVER